MDQMSLFGGTPPTAQTHRRPDRMRVLITVTAAPNPSATHGETVCVAGVRIDPEHEGWIRLYPVNLRHLGEGRFHKYDVIHTWASPQTKNDQRLESWAPRIDSLQVTRHLDGWARRMPYLSPLIRADMCSLISAAKADPKAPSLALIRPKRVTGLIIKPHPGWTREEQLKIDAYVNQMDLLQEDKTPLEAPQYRAWYKFICGTVDCNGHELGLLDWEFTAFQRRLRNLREADAKTAVRKRWLEEICSPMNDVMFYVGNQAKRRHVFSVLGAVYPKR